MSNKSTDAWNRGVYLALVKLIHLIAAVHFCYGVYYDFAYVHVPAGTLRSNRAKFGGKFKYLTILNAVIHWSTSS